MAVLIVASAIAAVLASGAASPAWAVSEGERAPEVDWVALGPEPVALGALAGRVVVVDFWASWCAPCRAQLEALDALLASEAHPDLVVLAVSIDDDAVTARRYLDERFPRARFRAAHDSGGAAMADFGAAGIPAYYVLDRDGVVRVSHFGEGGADDLAARLAPILGEAGGASAADDRTVE